MGTVLRTSQLANLQTSLNVQFIDAYKAPQELIYPQLTTEIPATKKNVLVAIADMVPQMREWLGDRVFHNPSLHSQLIENKHYELSMEVDADDVNDDELASAFLSSSALGDRAQEHPDVLLAQALKAASTTLGFDSQFYFDTDHPTNVQNGTGTSQVNLFTGRPLNAANWEYVVAQMASWRAGAGAGQLIGAVPTAVVVPRQLEPAARRLFQNENIINAAGTATEANIYRGAAKVIVFDKLNDDPNVWYAVDLRSRLKPFILVRKQAPRFVMKNRPDDQGMFENNKVQFGVDGRWGIGLAAWFRAVKVVTV